MKKLTPAEKAQVDYIMQYAEGRHMLEKVATKINTRLCYAKGVKFLCDFLQKTPTVIVQEYQGDVKANSYEAYDKWERIFDDFVVYLAKEKNFGSASVAVYHSGAKNLINANVPRSVRLQAKAPSKVSRTIAGVTFADLKQIFNIADVRERAIIAFLKDSGMSKADVLPLNLEILENFDRGDEFIHLSVFREKEGVEYETFIGPNAVEALHAYFALRRSRGENLTPKSPLFAVVRKPFIRMEDTTVSTLFTRLTQKSGKTVTTHRLRKFFETYMALTVRHPIILKYWMGHRIGKSRDIEARYIIPPTPEQLKLYQDSYRNIDLTGGTLEERAKQAAKEQFEKMLTPEQKEVIAKSGLKLMRKKESEKKDKCTDDEHCDFEQISEAELLQHLRDGWQILHNLSDGQIIVRRN